VELSKKTPPLDKEIKGIVSHFELRVDQLNPPVVNLEKK
jgi:hypothetical protein